MLRSSIPVLALLLFSAAAAAPPDSVMALLDAGWKPAPTAAALLKRGEPFTLLPPDSLAGARYPLGSHPVLVVDEWWNEGTAAALNTARDRIRTYVENGGIMVIFYSLHTPCDNRYWTSSWSPVPVYVRLNNAADDCRTPVPRFRDVVENGDHPLFSGFNGLYIDVDGEKSFSSADPYWYILAKSREQGLPTVMERKHGKGTYVLVGPALAYQYGTRQAATRLFDNTVTYALSLADRVRQERIDERKRQIADSLAAVTAAREQAAADSILAAQEAARAAEEAARLRAEKEAAEKAVPAAADTPPAEPAAEPAAPPADAGAAAAALPLPADGELLPLRVGNTWEFSNEQVWSISGTKSILNRETYILNFSAGMGVYFIGRGPEGIMLYGTSEGGVENISRSPQVLFRYPAAEGTVYRSDIVIGGTGATVTVAGTNRQIETDMGVFSCYEYMVELENGVQYWFLCPEIGFVRYMNADENMVLVDYTVE